MSRWYRLDNVAKLFPSVTSARNSSVFRVSAVLNEEIDGEILQKSVIHIYKRYPTLFVKLRRGVFWNYFEKTSEDFYVEQECEYPCAAIDSKINGGYLIKVLYYNKRISVEVFHALTDGNGAMEFLKSLVFYYLRFSGHDINDEGKIITMDTGVDNHELEDSFNRYYDKNVPKLDKKVNAYMIKGDRFSFKGTNVISGVLNIGEFKSFVKKSGETISSYLIASLIDSIYNTRIKFENSKKPIVVAVPVNLRNKFESKTMRNFFGVVNICIYPEQCGDFESIIKEVDLQIKEKMKTDYLKMIVADNLKIAKSEYSRMVPLFIKNIFVRLGFSFMGEEKKTITISNMGAIDLPCSMNPYIKHFESILYPTAKSPMNCCVCSVDNKMVISFSRAIDEDDILKHFYNSFNEKGIEAKVYSNNWGGDIDVSEELILKDDAYEYPNYYNAYKERKEITAYKIISFLVICAGLVCTFINILTYTEFPMLWSMIVDASLASLWLIVVTIISKRITAGGRILSYFWIFSCLLFVIDVCTGFYKWSTTYIIPFMTIALTFLITIIAIIRRRLYKDYMGYLLMAVFTGVCPILLFAFSLSSLLWTCLCSVLYSVLTIIGLFIFSDKNLKKELSKRFHF